MDNIQSYMEKVSEQYYKQLFTNLGTCLVRMIIMMLSIMTIVIIVYMAQIKTIRMFWRNCHIVIHATKPFVMA